MFSFIALLIYWAVWSPVPLIRAGLQQIRVERVRDLLGAHEQIVMASDYPTNPALAPPVPLPQGSCVSQAPTGTHGITVCWTASISTVTGYNVYVSTTTGGPYTKQNTALVSGTSFFYATPNLGGVKQFVVVRSFDGTSESVNSTEISVTALGNPQPPTGVQAVAADLRWRGAVIVRRRLLVI